MSVFLSLLDNAPNYLVGCVIQKSYPNKASMKPRSYPQRFDPKCTSSAAHQRSLIFAENVEGGKRAKFSPSFDKWWFDLRFYRSN